MGDPSGVGAVCIAKALKALRGPAAYVVIGDRRVFEKACDKLPASRRATNRGLGRAAFCDLRNAGGSGFSFGAIKAEYGRASIEYLDCAMDLIKRREIDCLVTCPISKEAVHLAGFTYAGHTEYLMKKTRTEQAVMMLANRKLKFSLVTRHLPLRAVASRLTSDDIYKTIVLTQRSLRRLFNIKEPRIVVCGLNPHASDNGLIGDEENRIIRPALARLEGFDKGSIDGPLPADAAIEKAAGNLYDCVIAMYHDQALIPLKLTGRLTGVNITLGLPFVRTSPLHGTAFDIAAAGSADPASLLEAVTLAIRCATHLKKA